MTRRVTAIGLLVVAAAMVVFVLSRRAGQGGALPKPGMIVLELAGPHPATMTLPATVNWCPVSRVAELEAISVDTGFAIALRENEAMTKGPHPVFAPTATIALPRPSAAAALRWLRTVDTTVTVAAYSATGGHVDLDEAGATLSGSLLLYMRAAAGTDSVVVTGRFARLKVVAMAAGCT